MGDSNAEPGGGTPESSDLVRASDEMHHQGGRIEGLHTARVYWALVIGTGTITGLSNQVCERYESTGVLSHN